MLVSIKRTAELRAARFFDRRRRVFVISLAITFSNQERAAILQRNLLILPIMQRPYHRLWRLEFDDWREIQTLPVATLVYLHDKQRMMEIAYYENDFDAQSGENQLRRGLQTLKDLITGSKGTDRIEEFEL